MALLTIRSHTDASIYRLDNKYEPRHATTTTPDFRLIHYPVLDPHFGYFDISLLLHSPSHSLMTRLWDYFRHVLFDSRLLRQHSFGTLSPTFSATSRTLRTIFLSRVMAFIGSSHHPQRSIPANTSQHHPFVGLPLCPFFLCVQALPQWMDGMGGYLTGMSLAYGRSFG